MLLKIEQLFKACCQISSKWLVLKCWLNIPKLYIRFSKFKHSSDQKQLFSIFIRVNDMTFPFMLGQWFFLLLTFKIIFWVASVVSDFATPWAHQAPLSMGFSRQEHRSGLPYPPLRDLPDPGIKISFLCLLYWQVSSLPLAPPGKPLVI